MGVRQAARGALTRVLAAATTIPNTQGDVAQVSDFPNDVAQAFGINTDGGPITRRDAMKVPAFARGRNTICTTVGSLQLRAVKGDVVDTTRQVLVQPDPAVTRQHTLTWLVDDLLCNGVGWTRVLERDANGWPTRLERIARHRIAITVEPTLEVRIDGRPVDPADVKRFDAPHEGVLTYGADTLRTALALEQAVKRYAENPEPSSLLFDKRPMEADVPELDETARDKLLETWRDRGRTTTVRWLNRMVGYERLSFTPNELDLTAARQQAAVQVARLLGMPSRQVNAPSESGMTYTNVSADRQELLDTTCQGYLIAIEQRLSMPDITPRGWVVLFDRDGYSAGTTSERITNAAAFVKGSLGSVDEARSRYLGLGPAPAGIAQTPAPTPGGTP